MSVAPGSRRDDHLLLKPLADLGCHATATVWDDPQVDWDRFDLSVIRSTWDYTNSRDDFVAWAQSVPRLLNPADVVGMEYRQAVSRGPGRGRAAGRADAVDH